MDHQYPKSLILFYNKSITEIQEVIELITPVLCDKLEKTEKN